MCVLSDIQQVFKEDAGLEPQLDKTAIKGISAADALNAADTIVKADPLQLIHTGRGS